MFLFFVFFWWIVCLIIVIWLCCCLRFVKCWWVCFVLFLRNFCWLNSNGGLFVCLMVNWCRCLKLVRLWNVVVFWVWVWLVCWNGWSVMVWLCVCVCRRISVGCWLVWCCKVGNWWWKLVCVLMSNIVSLSCGLVRMVLKIFIVCLIGLLSLVVMCKNGVCVVIGRNGCWCGVGGWMGLCWFYECIFLDREMCVVCVNGF